MRYDICSGGGEGGVRRWGGVERNRMSRNAETKHRIDCGKINDTYMLEQYGKTSQTMTRC